MKTRGWKREENKAGNPLPAADWPDDGAHGVPRPALTALLLLLALVPSLRAQSYTIDWYKVSGGGGMNSTGGIYQVSGTIGQHEAGGSMTGGGYSLTGGFWGWTRCKPSARRCSR